MQALGRVAQLRLAASRVWRPRLQSRLLCTVAEESDEAAPIIMDSRDKDFSGYDGPMDAFAIDDSVYFPRPLQIGDDLILGHDFTHRKRSPPPPAPRPEEEDEDEEDEDEIEQQDIQDPFEHESFANADSDRDRMVHLTFHSETVPEFEFEPVRTDIDRTSLRYQLDFAANSAACLQLGYSPFEVVRMTQQQSEQRFVQKLHIEDDITGWKTERVQTMLVPEVALKSLTEKPEQDINAIKVAHQRMIPKIVEAVRSISSVVPDQDQADEFVHFQQTVFEWPLQPTLLIFTANDITANEQYHSDVEALLPTFNAVVKEFTRLVDLYEELQAAPTMLEQLAPSELDTRFELELARLQNREEQIAVESLAPQHDMGKILADADNKTPNNKLPPSFADTAPDEELRLAALALEQNPSYTDAERAEMLKFLNDLIEDKFESLTELMDEDDKDNDPTPWKGKRVEESRQLSKINPSHDWDITFTDIERDLSAVRSALESLGLYDEGMDAAELYKWKIRLERMEKDITESKE